MVQFSATCIKDRVELLSKAHLREDVLEFHLCFLLIWDVAGRGCLKETSTVSNLLPGSERSQARTITVYHFPLFQVPLSPAFFLHNFILNLCMWVICLYVCLYTVCMLSACGGQKRTSDPLEPELQMVVTHHVGAGNQTWDLWKSSQSS